MKPQTSLNLIPPGRPTAQSTPCVRIDLRGKQCPMTFVYTKLELEQMSAGQVLEVVLDYPPSFTNVPRSVSLQELGETVRHDSHEPGELTLWIRKA